MKIYLLLAALIGGMFLNTHSHAADFKKGLNAKKTGNIEAALREFKPLAESGHKNAQFQLGLLYAFGEGVQKDLSLASEWFHRSAEQGHARSQVILSSLYFNGQGLKKDIVYAHMWASIAATNGDKAAIPTKRILEMRLTPEQKEKSLKLISQCTERKFKDC